ncbi:MAG TPA: carbohydrate-binding family 9-like protein [Pyrinomonadaceae bacterium]|nr:carbohydrate-binding family 9-like protein [Pyrinomonadaceae bacterium]
MANSANRSGKTLVAVTGSLIFCLAAVAEAQRMSVPTAKIRYTTNVSAIGDLDNREWKRADEVTVATYWNGEVAPQGRMAKVRMLWSASDLSVRFEASQSEPLVVNEKPQTGEKTMQLWDRDVVEIFLAPDAKHPRKYFEFEVAPTGEWIDIAIDFTGPKRESNWDYSSQMTSAARIDKNAVVTLMRIPWTAFGTTPKAGDVWLGNLLRCVGEDPTRGYLAWSPTMTEQPNFHVPEKFGRFEFTK